MFTQKETLVSAFLCTSKPFRRKLLSFLNFPLVLTFLQLKFLFFNIFTSKSNKKEKKKLSQFKMVDMLVQTLEVCNHIY